LPAVGEPTARSRAVAGRVLSGRRAGMEPSPPGRRWAGVEPSSPGHRRAGVEPSPGRRRPVAASPRIAGSRPAGSLTLPDRLAILPPPAGGFRLPPAQSSSRQGGAGWIRPEEMGA